MVEFINKAEKGREFLLRCLLSESEVSQRQVINVGNKSNKTEAAPKGEHPFQVPVIWETVTVTDNGQVWKIRQTFLAQKLGRISQTVSL